MRVRFAPSPTGYLHIGNARTAVINHLIAKKNNADFIIRIEDTDRIRSTIESEISILEDLKWLGIEWTEGSDKVKDCGPYRQSERNDIYNEYTEKLLEKGAAFRCFCTREEVEEDKEKAVKENRPFLDRCRDFTEEEQEKLIAEKKDFTVKFKVPENETISFIDGIKGEVSFNSSHIGGDFIIVRSDGGPVYNYIVIIDDTLMRITHVIRGEDHLSNTPKQIIIAKALGLPVPEYSHMPLIMGNDKKKLSKRHGITSVDLYRKEGYLPEALMNYLGLLGWATDSGEELLSEEELIKQFDISKIGKSAAIFDFQKLKWMNSHYLKSKPLPELIKLFSPYLDEAGYNTKNMDKEFLNTIISNLTKNCEILSDIKDFVGIFLDEINTPNKTADALLKEEYSIDIIKIAMELIPSIDKNDLSNSLVEGIKSRSEHKGKKLFHPIRAMVTGRLSGPDLNTAIPIIGYDKILKRIEYCYKTYC